MTDRRFYQSIGICPNCHKERLYGDEKECLKCCSEKYAYLRKFREEHPDYDKNKRAITYKKRSLNHQCTQCGVQLDTDYKYKMCSKCLIRARVNLKLSRERRGMGGL